VYVNGASDMAPALMDAFVAMQASRIRGILLRRLPADHVHVFTGDDYDDGTFAAELEAVARAGGSDPVDIFTLSHSGGDDMPLGRASHYTYRAFKDTLFAVIPARLRGRLRLFFNAGCLGARAYEDAFAAGFAQVVGAAKHGSYYGNPGLDSFLHSWTQEQDARAAASHTNWECRHSPTWWTWAISGVDGPPQDAVQDAWREDSERALRAGLPPPPQPKDEADMEAYCATTDLVVIDRIRPPVAAARRLRARARGGPSSAAACERARGPA
jgi:hypothetical protein